MYLPITLKKRSEMLMLTFNCINKNNEERGYVNSRHLFTNFPRTIKQLSKQLNQTTSSTSPGPF